MAAEAEGGETGGTMTVAEGDASPQPRDQPLYLRRLLGAGAAPMTVANRGTGAAWRTVSITGVPKSELPAESKGYTVSRAIYRANGSAADLKKVRQTDLFVVVIKGKRGDASRAARTLVVDLLPAGFEIESATPTSQSGNFPWLKDLTETAYTEQRDDRYVAALDLGENKAEFTLAYVVRAITPGAFTYPPLAVEDMYEPETTGRTAMSNLTVHPR